MKRIIEALDKFHLTRKFTPATVKPLVKNKDGYPQNITYNYDSVIGMLQYIQGHSHPDITYAVIACANFLNSTRRSHEISIERIGKYVKGTLEEGLILRPSGELYVDVYCNANFYRVCPYNDKHDPTCVNSCTYFSSKFHTVWLFGQAKSRRKYPCPLWKSSITHYLFLGVFSHFNVLSRQSPRA